MAEKRTVATPLLLGRVSMVGHICHWRLMMCHGGTAYGIEQIRVNSLKKSKLPPYPVPSAASYWLSTLACCAAEQLG